MNRKIESIIVTLLLVAGSGFVLLPVNADPSAGENELMFCGPGDTTGTYIDVTVGDTDLRYDFYAKLLNVTDTISASGNQSAYVEWTPANALNYSNAVLADIFENTSVSKLPGSNYDNDAGWIRDLMWGDTSPSNDTEGRVFNMTWDALKVGTVTIYHNDSQTAYAGEYCPTTLRINGEIRIHPQDPSSFSIADEGPDWFNMSWATADGIDKYVLFRDKSGYPADTTGTPLYNGTALYYNDTGLDIEDDYYYSLWGWNETAGFFSLTYETVLRDSENSLPTSFTATTQNKTIIDLAWTSTTDGKVILRPNDNGSSDDWNTGSTYNWQAVDDISADGDDSFIRTDSDGDWDSYNIQDFTAEYTIEKVTIYAELKGDNSETCKITIYDGTSTEKSSDFTPATSYDTYSNEWTTNPFTSLAWTETDINELEIGLEYTGAALGEDIYATQLYLEVEYDLPTFVIERKESPETSWSQGDGDEIYNGTGVSFSDTGLTPDTFYNYQLWTYDGTAVEEYSDDFLAANDRTTDNINVTITNPYPADSSTDVDKMYSQVSIDLADGDGDLIDYTIEGEYLTDVDVSGASNGTYTTQLNTPLPYDATVTWYVNATDGHDPQTEVFSFTVRSEFVPAVPDSFNATSFNRTQIDLTWNKVTLGEYVYIERNTEETWARGEGTEIYNGTGTAYSDDGSVGLGGRLDDGVQYFYQAWSYNVTDNVYSVTYSEDNDTTTGNQVPNQPSSVVIHNDDYVSVYDAYLNVTVSDPDADELSVTFYWANHTAIYFNSAVTNGSYVNISLPDYIDPDWLDHDTKYEWYVVVDDSFDVYNTSTEVGNYWFNTTHNTDLNENGEVEVLDASNLVSNWGANTGPGGWIAADINNNGEVEVLDASSLVSDWGWQLNP